jgi:hypothetical protein
MRRRKSSRVPASTEDLGVSTGGQLHVRSLLIDEVKVGCSLAMPQCLDRPHRAAYLLGELMELSVNRGARSGHD